MRRRPRGLIQVLVACGCLAAVVGIAVAAGAIYFFFFRQSQPVGPPALTDTGQVRGLCQQILPGIELPAGQVGFLGQSSGHYILGFVGPAGLDKASSLQPGQLLVSVAAFPAGQATQAAAEKALLDCLNGQGWLLGKQKSVEPQGDVMVPVGPGGLEGRGQRRIRTLDKKNRVEELSLLLENADGKTVVLLATAAEGGMPREQLQTFLGHLRVRPLGSPAAIPTPHPIQTPGQETPGGLPSPTDPATPEVETQTPEVPSQAPESTPRPKPKPTKHSKP